MIHYLLESNPDDRIINQAIDLLKNDQIICLQTDTSWVFAMAMSKKALEQLSKIKRVGPQKHLSLLCQDISQASHYAFISDFAYKIIKKHLPGPYTFIFRPNVHLPKPIQNYKKTKQIGIRIPQSNLCHTIIKKMECPILTTSLTADLLENKYPGNEEEILSYMIEDEFKNDIEMILDNGEFTQNNPSSIIDFSEDKNNESYTIIRRGMGDLSYFE